MVYIKTVFIYAGELCAAKFTDDEWYRGKVQKLMGPKAQVLYVDYGNSTEVSIQNLAPLPPGLNVAKPFAHEYGIACVKPAPVGSPIFIISSLFLFSSCYYLNLFRNAHYSDALYYSVQKIRRCCNILFINWPI